MPGLTRRALLRLAGLLLAGACVRPADRAAPSPVAPQSLPPEFDTWNREAQGMLSDALKSLRTFDVFMAFRATAATDAASRTSPELDWDPPTSADWNEATHVAQGLQARADQLFQAVSTAHLDASLWREQRTLAEGCRALVDLGAALAAYRQRVDVLPPGNARDAVDPLDRAWAQWTDSAARWGLSRAEPIGCAS